MAAPLPRAVATAHAGQQPGVPAVPGHTYARKGKHDPVSLSHLLGGFAPTRAGAWTTACCCRCYFLSVFLDINTSSLHPQDGFQASILFPMATKTQPGNHNPLARLSRKPTRPPLLQAREVGGAPTLRAGRFSSTQNSFKAKLLAL